MLPAGSLWLCAGSASKRSLTLLKLMGSRPCSVSGRKEAFVGMLPHPATSPHPQVSVLSLEILVNAGFCS